MYCYSVLKENFYASEHNKRDGFGITASKDNREIIVLHDVFTDFDEARRIISVMNNEQLDIIHLEQFIDEYLQYGYPLLHR